MLCFLFLYYILDLFCFGVFDSWCDFYSTAATAEYVLRGINKSVFLPSFTIVNIASYFFGTALLHTTGYCGYFDFFCGFWKLKHWSETPWEVREVQRGDCVYPSAGLYWPAVNDLGLYCSIPRCEPCKHIQQGNVEHSSKSKDVYG